MKTHRRIVISGSRELNVSNVHVEALLGYGISSLVNMWQLSVFPTKHFTIMHGAARGVDEIAHKYFTKGYDHVEPHPADWDKFGKAAGVLRNKYMIDTGVDGGIVIWNGWSPGTFDMITRLDALGVEYVLFRVPG